MNPHVTLPCYGRGVYSFNKPHERWENQLTINIEGVEMDINYCRSCIKALSRYGNGWGFHSIILHYTFNECGIFKPLTNYQVISGIHFHDNNAIEWCKNSRYIDNRDMVNDKDYVKVFSDSFNTYYVKRKYINTFLFNVKL